MKKLFTFLTAASIGALTATSSVAQAGPPSSKNLVDASAVTALSMADPFGLKQPLVALSANTNEDYRNRLRKNISPLFEQSCRNYYSFGFVTLISPPDEVCINKSIDQAFGQAGIATSDMERIFDKNPKAKEKFIADNKAQLKKEILAFKYAKPRNISK